MAEPKLRFTQDDGSCYPEWRTKTFSEIFESLNNNSFSREMLNYKSGNVRNIHYGDILVKYGNICDVQKDDIPFVNAGLDTEKYERIKDGDVILADTAEDDTVGKAIEIVNTKEDIIISGLHTMACRPVLQFASKYLGYYTNSPAFHNQLRPYMQGVKVTSISRTNIAAIGLASPVAIEEQQKIADFLFSVDEVISSSEQEVANLETQKKAVMKKIFSQEVRFKKADGSDFPEWEARDFKEEADYLSGLTYSPDDVVLDADDGILVLRSSNIQDGVIDYQDNVFVKCKISDNLFVQENDILMCVRNGSKKLVGKTALIKKSDLGHTWGAFMMIIRSHTDNRFIYHYLNSDNFYTQMFPDVTTDTIAQITKGMLHDCVVEMPCLKEQRLIADFLSDIDEAIAAAKKELELWKEMKKGLLQQMFV